MGDFGSFVQATWLTDGVSEFVSALLGGAFAIGAQQLAVRHDRKKDAKIVADQNKGRAWAIYFKVSSIHEALTEVWKTIEEAKATADAANMELWQVLQFPPHDWREVHWETAELVLLIDHKLFRLMQSYQEGTWWLSNYIQSARRYREMRLEFLQGRPGSIKGNMGVITLKDQAEHDAIMPTIVHLRTLADSLAEVISAQQPDARKLLKDYAAAMKDMIGHGPTIEFKDEKSRAKGEDAATTAQA